MKALIVGLGSAGQRHMRNLKKIFGENIEFHAYRIKKKARLFDENFNIVENISVVDEYNIKVFEDYQEALMQRPNFVIIATPNSLHIEFAIAAAKAGCDIFLEKPISNSWNGVEELKNIVAENNTKLYVGFQYRFHPCLIKAKKILDENQIGRIIHVQCEVGELITQMHKYENYRDMNEAKKSMGGGVVISQIHEIDYIFWMFGLPKEVYSVGGKYSDLDLDVEDSSTTFCIYVNHQYEFPVIIHQDFLQKNLSRSCKIVGTNGCIEIDLINSIITTSNYDGMLKEKFEDFQRNDMFILEMKAFIECVSTRAPEAVSLNDGIGSLKIALAIKESIEKRQFVKI